MYVLVVERRLVVLGLHRIDTHVVLIGSQSLGLPHYCGSELRCLHHDWCVH